VRDGIYTVVGDQEEGCLIDVCRGDSVEGQPILRGYSPTRFLKAVVVANGPLPTITENDIHVNEKGPEDGWQIYANESRVRLTQDVSVFAKKGDVFHVANYLGDNVYSLWSKKGAWTFATSGENFEPMPVTDEEIEQCRITPENIRTFSTGATRNLDTTKLDYEGFLSPNALQEFAAYMHKHRAQADGSIRDSDNWQKGIPEDVYLKSMFRHFMDLWTIHRGGTAHSPEDNHTIDRKEALCALMFNVQGLLHELTKP